MSDNPWGDLRPPTSSSAISARRVDEVNPWHLFWALDQPGRCLLVLCHAAAAAPRQRLPLLREIEVRSESLPGGQPVLVLRLLDPSLRDVFFQLCSDIVGATTRCLTEAEAVEAAVGRTWRWHHLLRGGRGRLGAQEQKGLIGELLVLEHYLLPVIGPAAAISAWNGPVGSSKDFVSGVVGVESKTRGEGDGPSVVVSSEIQLADEELAHLFLHICILDPATHDDGGAFTLSDVAGRVRDTLAGSGEAVTGRYEALLAAAGFRFEDDYSDSPWLDGARSIYRVAGAFPRLTPDCIAAGLSRVRYTLSLTQAADFMAEPNDLRSALAGSV